MIITEVKLKKLDNGGNLKAVAEVTFDGELTVKDIRLIDGPYGWFAAMPSRKGADGKYRDVVFAGCRAVQNMISDAVIDAYTSQEEKR